MKVDLIELKKTEELLYSLLSTRLCVLILFYLALLISLWDKKFRNFYIKNKHETEGSYYPQTLFLQDVLRRVLCKFFVL